MTRRSTNHVCHRDIEGQIRVMASEFPNGSRHTPTPLSRMHWVRSEVLSDRFKSIDLIGLNQVLRHPLLHERIRGRNPRYIGELKEHLHQLIPRRIDSSLVLTKIRGQPDAALHRHPQVRRHRIGNQIPLDNSDHFRCDPLGLELSHTLHSVRDDGAPHEVIFVRVGDEVRVEDRERTPRAQMHPIWRHLRAPQTEGGGHVQPDFLTRPLVLPPVWSEVTIVPSPMIHYRVIIEHVRSLPRTYVDLVPNGKALSPCQKHRSNQRPMYPKVHYDHHVPT